MFVQAVFFCHRSQFGQCGGMNRTVLVTFPLDPAAFHSSWITNPVHIRPSFNSCQRPPDFVHIWDSAVGRASSDLLGLTIFTPPCQYLYWHCAFLVRGLFFYILFPERLQSDFHLGALTPLHMDRICAVTLLPVYRTVRELNAHMGEPGWKQIISDWCF